MPAVLFTAAMEALFAALTIEAAVVLPDHLHCVWMLPPGDADCSGCWRAIKARFSRALAGEGIPIVRNARGEYDLW